MPTLRDHAIFTIEYTRDIQRRVEDQEGELTGYTQIDRISDSVNIVAPSKAVANAWLLDRHKGYDPKIESIAQTKLDAFIHEHVW